MASTLSELYSPARILVLRISGLATPSELRAAAHILARRATCPLVLCDASDADLSRISEEHIPGIVQAPKNLTGPQPGRRTAILAKPGPGFGLARRAAEAGNLAGVPCLLEAFDDRERALEWLASEGVAGEPLTLESDHSRRSAQPGHYWEGHSDPSWGVPVKPGSEQ